MGKRRLTVQREQQEGEENRTYSSGVEAHCHKAHTLCFKSYFHHVNSLNPDHMLCTQSPLGGGKVEIWSRIWSAEPYSQDRLSFAKWGEKNQMSRVGQVSKSMQRFERIYSSMRRGDMSAWKKIKNLRKPEWHHRCLKGYRYLMGPRYPRNKRPSTDSTN